MIGYLSGKLMQKQPPFLLMDVNGVGYELEAPMTTFYDLPDNDQPVSLFVHLVVREDAQLLFGFSDQPQRQLFRGLLKINGVGPRVALAILSTLSADQFIACIHQEDVLTLTRVPGIGKKTAERMILDMRDRIDALSETDGGSTSPGQVTVSENPVQDAIGALIALGYKAAEASRAVHAIEADSAQREDLIRNALQHLSKPR
jgi:Holliday junction DNA helicase RuvA